MNRRHFFAVTLPAVLGWSASRALAQDKPTPKLPPRRVKIEVSLLKPSLQLGSTLADTILIVTEEGVETYAAFAQVKTLQGYDPQTKQAAPISQAVGPSLRVTPRIERDGKITLSTEVRFEEAVPGTGPAEASSTVTRSVTVTRTVQSGLAVTLGGTATGDAQEKIQLTATLLKPHQAI